MPLSEEELRQLEQMERALAAEDPKFASALRGTRLRRNARRRSVVAAGVFVAGIAVLMTGAITSRTVVGIIGFVVMLGSAYVALTSWRAHNSASESAEHPERGSGNGEEPFGLSLIDGGKAKKSGRKWGRGRNKRPSASFMDRLEERWHRRRDQNGGF